MSNAAALGIGLGLGFAASVLLTVVGILGWFDRGGRGRVLVVFASMLAAPLIGAISMPTFKTALVLWLGFPIGFALAYPVTLPMRQLAKKRR